MLPHGEIPDALTPPAGCRFHPRCPRAFEPCGWEGADLVAALEDRWTQVDDDVMERELAMVGGDLADAQVDRDHVRFPGGDAEALRRWVADAAPTLPTPIHLGIDTIERDGGDAVVTFRERVVPVPQEVAGRQVSCHLHGVVGPAS